MRRERRGGGQTGGGALRFISGGVPIVFFMAGKTSQPRFQKFSGGILRSWTRESYLLRERFDAARCRWVIGSDIHGKRGKAKLDDVERKGLQIGRLVR